MNNDGNTKTRSRNPQGVPTYFIAVARDYMETRTNVRATTSLFVVQSLHVIPAQGPVDKPKITPLVPHSLLCVRSEDVAELTIYTSWTMCLFLLIGESDTFSTGPQAGIQDPFDKSRMLRCL